MTDGVIVNDQALVSETKAAQFLAISKRTLRNWRTRGQGPRYIRVSKRCIRYRISDLLKWTEDRTLRSTSDQRIIKSEI